MNEEKLSKKIINHITYFGGSFNVFAVRDENGISTRFVDADEPIMDEILSKGKEPTEENLREFEELRRSYQKGIVSIQGTDYDKLPLALLLLKVEEQEKVLCKIFLHIVLFFIPLFHFLLISLYLLCRQYLCCYQSCNFPYHSP